MGKILVIIGLVIVVIGVLLIFKVPIGQLPGDIAVKGEHFQFYFPIVSSIILSIILSLLFYLFLGKS